jgi:periplasmic protein TonB
MSYSAVPQFENGYKEPRFAVLFVISVLFHAFFLVVVPLIAKISWKAKPFDRPQTFQLVTAPAHKAPPINAKQRQRITQKESKPEPSPIPQKQSAKKQLNPSKEKEAAQNEENVDELASMLDELPSPAQVASVGNFKYHWYLNNVQEKLQRYWNPATENKNIRVEVSFTIYSDGTISEPKISRSSGNSTLDDLALRAVRLAAPFGKLPPGFSGDRLELTCTLIPTRK